MKKLFAFLLAAVMLVCLCACADTAPAEQEDHTPVVEQSHVEEEAPAKEETPVEVETPVEEEAPVEEDVPVEEEAPSGDAIRPEFKKAMDDYEAFYDEYCQFMEKYKKNPTDLSLLTEYANMSTKLLEMDKSFGQWESENMNDAELSYYLEVSSRVAQKILDAAS